MFKMKHVDTIQSHVSTLGHIFMIHLEYDNKEFLGGLYTTLRGG
jgi:hypothetical protein